MIDSHILHADMNQFNEYQIFCNALYFIQKCDFNTAYKLICKWKMTLPPSMQGIGCRWEQWYNRGITDLWLQVSILFIEKSHENLISATSLFSLYSGIPNKDSARMLSKLYDLDFEDVCRKVRHETAVLSGELNALSYKEYDIKEYQFLATLDNYTCPVCRKLDGKIFLVNEQCLGVNFPPMHSGCRCTTISVVDRELIDKMQRSAIDPATGKRIKVPRSMNYEEWYNKYVIHL